jgi:hypothetical protein
MNNQRFEKIKNYLEPILSYWQSGMERVAGGNISSIDIEKALKTDTLQGYKDLVFELYKDENNKTAEKLEKLIEEVEKD